MIDLLIHSIDAIEQEVLRLQSHFPSPTFVRLPGGISAFRHDKGDDLLMSYLKCVRSVSMLRAGVLLVESGFYQEIGILCRCLSESFEDVLFLATPLGEDKKPSKAQIQLMEEFFQEEFEDPSKPVASQQKRQRVPRDQVLAGIARIDGNALNPSDAKLISRSLHMGFSGYVHGAYPHIMELFGARPDEQGRPDVANGQYSMSGGMPNARVAEMLEALASRAHNTAVAVSIVGKRLNDKTVEERLSPVMDALSKATGSDIGDPNTAVKMVKQGKPLG
jgi:hypothetical protein